MSGYCHTHVECVWYVCHIEKKAVKIFDTHTLTLMFHKKKQKSCCFPPMFITIATLLPSRPVATPPSQITPASTISLRGVYPSKDKVIFVPAMPLSIAEAIGGRNFVPPLLALLADRRRRRRCTHRDRRNRDNPTPRIRSEVPPHLRPHQQQGCTMTTPLVMTTTMTTR